MLTVEAIREKVNTYPTNQPVKDLLLEILLLYKVERGLQEAKAGMGLSLDQFNNELDTWWKSK